MGTPPHLWPARHAKSLRGPALSERQGYRDLPAARCPFRIRSQIRGERLGPSVVLFTLILTSLLEDLGEVYSEVTGSRDPSLVSGLGSGALLCSFGGSKSTRGLGVKGQSKEVSKEFKSKRHTRGRFGCSSSGDLADPISANGVARLDLC